MKDQLPTLFLQVAEHDLCDVFNVRSLGYLKLD